MANTEGVWKIVKSKYEKTLEKKIQKEISNKSVERNILGTEKLFSDSNKLVLNYKILKNKDGMAYVKNNFLANKKLVPRLNDIDLKSLAVKYRNTQISLENYSCISYPYKLSFLNTFDKRETFPFSEILNFIDLIHGWKISLKDKDVYQVLLLFRTNVPKLPYSFVRYIQTKNNIIKQECILLNNYLEVLLFLYRHELNLVLRKKTLVNGYPINFLDINKEQVNSYFVGFRKIKKSEPFHNYKSEEN